MKKAVITVVALVATLVTLAVGFLFGYFTKSTIDYNSGVAPDITQAICTFPSYGAIEGYVLITETQVENSVFISGRLNGSEGRHGFHIHELGDLGEECKKAMGHYNPHMLEHGGPADSVRHNGDLGNIDFSNGESTFNFTDYKVTLRGKESVVGRSFVIHQKEDDMGKGGANDSKTTGAAGPRIACCVIGIAKTA